MNFKKTLAAIAAASVAVVSTSFAASAELDLAGAAQDANGMDLVCATPTAWMPIAYNNGERNATVLADKNKAIVDYGVDWSKAASIEVVFHVVEGYEEDWAEENNFGGAIILSSNAEGNATHNWNQKEFYGVTDDTLTYEDGTPFTAESAKELQTEKIGDYTYKVVCPIDDTNSVVDNPQLVQICFADYATAVWWKVAVETMTVKDSSGNALIAWQGAAPRGGAAAAVVEETAVEETVEEEAVEEEAVEEEAVEETAVEETVVTAAPATGDVQAAVVSSKGSPDTGIEDVAGVAGLAVVAAGAFIIAKKRK